jgi:hypothetical protein
MQAVSLGVFEYHLVVRVYLQVRYRLQPFAKIHVKVPGAPFAVSALQNNYHAERTGARVILRVRDKLFEEKNRIGCFRVYR